MTYLSCPPVQIKDLEESIWKEYKTGGWAAAMKALRIVLKSIAVMNEPAPI